jgi:hypothetical protein
MQIRKMKIRKMRDVMAELEVKRAQMVEVGMRKGFTDPETVRISQELDELHNEQLRIQMALRKQLGGVRHVG